MKNILLFLFLFLSSKCAIAQDISHAQKFSFHKITNKLPYSIDSITQVVEVVPFKSGFICKLYPQGFLVYDSSYHRDSLLEKKLASFNPKHMFFYSDAAWMYKDSQLYVIGRHADFIEQEHPFFFTADTFGYIVKQPLHSDDAFIVYGCCHGEFGANVSFFNKNTHKTYVFPTECPVQAIKIKDKYHIYGALNHMTGFEEILSISDVTDLFEATDHANKKDNCDVNEMCCNSFAPDSAILNTFDKKEINEIVNINGVQDLYTIKKHGTTFIMAFEYKNDEYILREVDSLYILSIKHEFTETPIDSVKNNTWTDDTVSWSVVNKSQQGYLVSSNNNTIIKVFGNKIEIIE